MKKSIIWGIILVLTLVLTAITSCSKDDVLRLEQSGKVFFKGQITNSNITGKSTVPLCGDEEPISIRYTFTNESGYDFIETSTITKSYNSIWHEDTIELPVGIYMLTEISLLSSSGNITHITPNSNTEGFNFSALVRNPLPHQIEVKPDEDAWVESELICYSSQILELDGSVRNSSEIIPLATLYFQIPEGGCVNRVTVDSDELQIIDIEISGRGIRGVPIRKDFDTMEVTVWNSEEELSRITYFEYNTDGIMNFQDVVQFNIDCN